jgi:hypothetical protein
METGFGSPIWTPMDDYADWGHGSSILNFSTFSFQYTGVRGADTGFGSPFNFGSTPVFLSADSSVLPDSGNITLRLVSDAWATGSTLKPPKRLGGFLVTFINKETGEEFRGLGLKGSSCFTDFTQRSLAVRCPPMTLGNYDIAVEWETINHVTISNAFRIVVSSRCESLYAIRSYLPSWFAKGEVSFEQDVIGEYEKTSNMNAVLSVLGELFQTFGGRPCTANTAEYSWGDDTIYVESTIGFPTSGSLFFDNIRISYTGKTDTSFTGVSTQEYLDFIPAQRKVALDVKSYF